MKLSELIERLEELRDELRFVHGDEFDPEVLGAYQKNYPLAGTILGAAAGEGPVPAPSFDLRPRGASKAIAGKPARSVVWIAVGGQPNGLSPYAPQSAFEVDG